MQANPAALGTQARRLFVDAMVQGIPSLLAVVNASASRNDAKVDTAPGARQRREDAQFLLNQHAGAWHQALADALTQALQPARRATPSTMNAEGLTLVEEHTIEREILTARLAQAIVDRTQWEFGDLRARMAALEKIDDIPQGDVLHAKSLAKMITLAWDQAGLDRTSWMVVERTLLDEFATLAQEAYHDANQYLVGQNVLPEIDLRPMIRRTRATLNTTMDTSYGRGGQGSEETRLMTRNAAIQRLADNAEVVISQLNNLVAKQLPAFAATQLQERAVSPRLNDAIGQAQQQGVPQNADGDIASTPALLEAMSQRKAALKEAATSQLERATIEIVALMFQAILTEERLPAAVRVWFARLQMPVLRVAVGEPDFFATVDHPARRLIDRMGACVMGFSPATATIGEALDKEIKRVVQVIEAYPDTGRRVFQTVLTEFERFLEHYFQSENEASKRGVSLAQQVEQRETLAIQYTIELRKMLNEVPVQEGIRNFLFQVWADVLALTAVKHGPQGEPTKAMRLAAADLIWSAGAKVSRDERAEVIRRLPPLLKTLRDGMATAGHSEDKQDLHVKALNESLAAAFSARAAAIPQERFDELRENLETLEELLPDATDVELDHTLMLDLSGNESSDLEVVQEGGSMPTPAMEQWAKELQVGSWYMLDYNGRHEAVQLAWTGMRRHLSLFVSAGGRCVLFQQPRLAAFLQAGLIVPAQEESLTTKATRSAIEKLDADPARLN